MTIYTLGHKSPDTDTVISSIAMAYLLNKIGVDAKPIVQETITKETEFVLNKFKINTPEIMTSVDGKDIALVDTTDPAQLPADLDKANIKYVVDHHRLGGLKSAAPLEIWIRPFGCTCTILKKMFDFYKVEIPSEIAGIMMCAILSDTVLFKSPTTTDEDKNTVKEFEKKSGFLANEIGMEMLRIKSSIEHDSAIDLINRDIKKTTIAGKQIAVGQIELIDIKMIDSKINAIKDEMKKYKTDNNLWGVLMIITDIMKEGSVLVSLTDDDIKIGKIFNVEFKNNEAWIDGMISRKKQVIPPLEAGL